MRISSLSSILVLLVALFTNSCLEEYKIDVSEQGEYLVVEGFLTNLEPPYTIKLSKTSGINTYITKPISGALVFIVDEFGNSFLLSEKYQGVYQSNLSDFQAFDNVSYQLKISIGQKKYQTNLIQLKPAVGIKKIYARPESKPIAVYPYNTVGYRFFIDAEESPDDSAYYFYQLTETYMFNSEFSRDFIFRNDSIIKIPYPESVELFTCWKSEQIMEFHFAEYIKQANSLGLSNFPLNYTDNTTRKLTNRYSLQATQISMHLDDYLFLKAISEQSNPDASLYFSQPWQITGNVYNVDDLSEKVLGRFIVGGAIRERIFVDAPLDILFHYPKCALLVNTNLRRRNPPVYLYSDDILGLGTADPECFDCRLKGGTIIKPDFWID